MIIKTTNEQRVFIVGDLHGEYDFFFNSLRKLGFEIGKDVLVCTGDLIDRGPNSAQILDLFMSTPNFYTVLGNHEDMALSKNIELHKYNGGSFFYKLSLQDQVKYKQWFKTLPITITIETGFSRYGVTHAQVNYEITDWDLAVSLGDGTLKQDLIWSRDVINNCESPHYQHRIVEGIELLFCGHSIVDQPTLVGNSLFIDLGANYYGRLCFIELKCDSNIYHIMEK